MFLWSKSSIFQRWSACALLFLLGFAGCGQSGRTPDGRLSIAVSIVPQVWMVEAIGGKHVEAFPVVAPGENPHTYQPSDAQVSRLMAARLFFRMGVPFEKGPWFSAVAQSGKLEIIDLRQGIEMLAMGNDENHDHDHAGEVHRCTDGCCAVDGKDPHTWLSPRNLRIQAKTVADALVKVDPDHAAEYQQNLAKVDAELDRLQAEIQAKLKPAADHAFFVFHPAWGYFARDFGLKQEAIEIDGREPSDQEVTAITEKIRLARAKVIFVQPQISGRSAKSIADATGAVVEIADPLAADLPAELRRVADIFSKACTP